MLLPLELEVEPNIANVKSWKWILVLKWYLELHPTTLRSGCDVKVFIPDLPSQPGSSHP